MAGLVDNRKEWDRIKREMRKARSLEVAVGIFRGRQNDKGKEVVEYAFYNENGYSVPSRPFTAISFDKNIKSMQKQIDKELSNVIAGKTNTVDALQRIGKAHEKNVKHIIKDTNIPPPLALNTVMKKGSTKTLIETTALLDSVTYRVRKSKK